MTFKKKETLSLPQAIFNELLFFPDAFVKSSLIKICAPLYVIITHL